MIARFVQYNCLFIIVNKTGIEPPAIALQCKIYIKYDRIQSGAGRIVLRNRHNCHSCLHWRHCRPAGLAVEYALVDSSR